MPEEVISDPQSPPDEDAATGESSDGESSGGEKSAGEAAGSDSDAADAATTNVAVPPPAPIDSPPPAAQPLKSDETEPRLRLHQLANELVRNRNRRLLVEFLQLRRALQ